MLSLRAAAARTRIPASPSLARLFLSKNKETLVGWNEELATPSEAFVKADRDTTTINEMQQNTVDHAQSHRPDPETEQTHATYARDEVGGPLGNPRVGEFEGVVGNDDLGPDDAQVEPNGRLVARRTMHDIDGGGSAAGQANA